MEFKMKIGALIRQALNGSLVIYAVVVFSIAAALVVATVADSIRVLGLPSWAWAFCAAAWLSALVL